jgi:hypothetical protein
VRRTSDLVALILAAGLSLSVISLVVGVIWAAIAHGNTAASLSDNESAVLTTAIGAMAGILGGWVGFKAAGRETVEPEAPWPNLQPPPERTMPRWPDKPKEEP